MCAYLRAKCELFSIILTRSLNSGGGGGGGEGEGGKSPAPENEPPKKPTQIKVKVVIKMVKIFTMATLESIICKNGKNCHGR